MVIIIVSYFDDLEKGGVKYNNANIYTGSHNLIKSSIVLLKAYKPM